jgi:RimJ/RimL family protein N-acetyltransferase
VNHFYERQFTRDDSRIWLERQIERYRRDGHSHWLVTLRGTGEPIGQVGLVLHEVDGVLEPEIGWLLHRPYWGHGYATEAGAASRDAAFDRWGHDHVISLIRPVNLPSQRVAQRLGLTAGRRVHFHGFEHIVFGITASDRRPPAPPAA